MIQSNPERAMICTVAMLGMVAIAPKVGRPSRHNWRRRLSGAGFADVNFEAPEVRGVRCKFGERHPKAKITTSRGSILRE